jgi:hypothetical protein
MNFKLAILGVVGAAVLGGCTAIVGEQTLQERAAFALGVDKSKVTISDVNKGALRIDFIATVGKKKTPCYVTTSYGFTSDALCSGKSNALLDAAGRK